MAGEKKSIRAQTQKIGIHPEGHGLPSDSSDFHDIVNCRIDNLGKLVIDLRGARSARFLKLAEWLACF